jgi:peptidoglycan/LPS O-acetylase OafA/YrhL
LQAGLSVVLFHAGLRFFPGGFVGVDVLGYLYLVPSEFRDFVGSLVAASFSVSSETPWIVSTLTACLGALLLLLAGETGSTLVGRCLALKPVVFIGLISYSLYLWHWPVIVFQQSNSMVFPDSASYASKVGLVAFSIALATLL